MTTQEFWKTFLETTGRDPGTTYYECFHFTNEEQLANELLALVLSGKKRATSSSKLCYAEGEGPKPGYLSIVTDFAGNPHCVIKTTAVQVIPFNEMTYEICSSEGRGRVPRNLAGGASTLLPDGLSGDGVRVHGGYARGVRGL